MTMLSQPDYLPGFATVTLTEGSQEDGELADGTEITVIVTGYTLPAPQMNVRETRAGGKMPWARRGSMPALTFDVTVVSVYAAIVSALYEEVTWTIVERLENERPLPDTSLTHTITGKLFVPTPSARNLEADEIRNVALSYRVNAYKQVKTNVTNPIWDIDQAANRYGHNGKDIFTGLTLA